MDVLVVGAGAIGTWFGTTVDADVTYTDVDPAAARQAADDPGSVTDIDASDTYDVVCLAVPMAAVEDAVTEQAPRADRAVLDCTGVMTEPLQAMAATVPDLERASVHPLFAPERGPGTVAAVTDHAGPVIESLLDDIEAAGNELLETPAAHHDTAMETVQASTHAAILAFALAAESVPSEFATPVYAELCDLAERVTAGNPQVYADIQATFAGATDVAEAATRIAEADAEGFAALYREAGTGACGARSENDGRRP